MVFEWKKNARIKADAQIVGEELEKIEEGKTAKVVLAVAKKNKKSELHKCFTWEDSVAAEQFRLDQARHVLNSIVEVVMIATAEGEETEATIRIYEAVRLPADDPKDTSLQPMTYVPTREALEEPELRVQIMNRLDSGIAELQTIARNYSYLDPIFKKTEKALQKARMTYRKTATV